MEGHVVLDVAIVIGIDDAVRQRVAQQALVAVAVGVDEAGNDDAVAGIDDCGVGGGNAWAQLADRAVLDQDVGGGEVADLRIAAEHDAALEQDAAGALQAAQLRIRALRRGRRRAQCRRRTGGQRSGARVDDGPARRPCTGARAVFSFSRHISRLPTHKLIGATRSLQAR